MKKLLLVVVLLMVLAGGCSPAPVSADIIKGTFYGRFSYYYDEAHDVSIWVWSHPYGGGISVLPAEQVKNPDAPMKLRK